MSFFSVGGCAKTGCRVSLMEKFTAEALRRFNGRNGNPVYVAFKGKVYDVSDSYAWRNGRHWVLHDAGADLTEQMKDAPHFEDVLEKFPVVGTCGSDG